MTLHRVGSKKLAPLSFLVFLALPLGSASAGEPEFEAPAGPPVSPEIWNGSDTETCAWPSVVRVTGNGSLCSGTLIHPKVVMYAAHCGAQDKTVYFGDSSNSSKTRLVEYCRVNPGYFGNQGNDWAYCVLQDEVTEIPFTPVGYGCEVQQHYYNGQTVAVVGFGNDSGDMGAGRKRWGFTQISQATNNRFDVGGGGSTTICSGDSGGPAFIRYADNTWHAYGIASTKNSGTCDSSRGTHSLAVNAVEWIEEDSGIDVTVCHDLAGNWDPGPLCGNFFNGEPALSYGSWNTWCQEATALDWSATCGDTFYNENFEINAPQLEVVIPYDGQVFETEPAMFDITVEAQDDSGLPVDVTIEIEGMPQGGVQTENPAIFANASFPCGEFTIQAFGTDFWGNQGESLPVTFTVAGDCMPEPGDGDGDPGGDGDGDPGDGDPGDGDPDSGTDTGDGETGGLPGQPGLGDADEGCACGVDGRRASLGGAGAWFALGLLGLGVVRRRR